MKNSTCRHGFTLLAGFAFLAVTACSDGPVAPTDLSPSFSHTSVPHSSYQWFQGFEVDTDLWVPWGAGTIHREASGFADTYASGIASSDGGWHARLRTTQTGGCAAPFSQGTSCVGPFNRWGKAGSANAVFPVGGYVTEVDVYLDVAWAGTNSDRRFDFSSAINKSSDGSHLRDFAFNAGTSPSGNAEWIVGASTNASRSNTFPSNSCPNPSTAPNACRAPVTIATSGWYTFQHTFREAGGVLAVDMKILGGGGAVVASWTISADPIGDVGGDRYGFFVNQEIHNLPIDNSGKRGSVVAPPADTEDPVVSNVTVTPNPAPYTMAIYTLTADATDDVAVTSASYTINGGSPVDFTFAAGTPVSLSASLVSMDVGVYDICVTAEDAAANVSNTECTMLAVYDPNAGFVTGGGWINSPLGAYVPDPDLTGRATFGFVSKYVKGKALPTGNTQFQFKAGDLSFSSTSYEWLVVSGARAQFRGAGTINGGGDYRFMLTAIDGQISGGGGTDKFRIRIWNNDGGGLVYDNQLNAPDSATPTTVIGGGSIVIHVPKK